MFEGIFLAIQGAASQGIIWGIMTLGVYITFKVLDFPLWLILVAFRYCFVLIFRLFATKLEFV